MIPKRFHFIWFNKNIPDYIPQDILCNIDTFQRLHPDWGLTIFTNKHFAFFENKMSEEVKRVYDKTTMLAQKIDIIRMIILNTYGGVYCDADMICINTFDDLIDCDFFVGEEQCKEESHQYKEFQIATEMHYINNGVIGSIANSYVIETYFKLLPIQENIVRVSLGPKLVEKTLYTLSQERVKFVGLIDKQRVLSQKFDKIVIYPHDYFYISPYFKSINEVKLTKNSKVLHLYFGTSKDGN